MTARDWLAVYAMCTTLVFGLAGPAINHRTVQQVNAYGLALGACAIAVVFMFIRIWPS